MKSERLARSEAMKQCQKLATATCTVDIVYSNGCVAMGWPIEGGVIVNNVDADRLSAEAGAIKRCMEKNGGACEIKFSDCSNPFFERF